MIYMEKLKFILSTIIVLAVVGLILYWSVTTIQSGSEYASNQTIKDLQQANDDLTKQVDSLTSQLGVLQAKIDDTAVAEAASSQAAVATQPTTYKYQTLINELQKLINDKVYMKLGSSGTRVGTVQNFLNLYNNASTKVDNDYGAGTVNAVTAFQKAQKISADGQAGAGTFSKMIDWLKKQN